MEFIRAINILSKASPASVASIGEIPEFDQLIKDYLYIETSIEKNFRELLNSLSVEKNIVFLSGSSGDGKSEILTRAQEFYGKSFLFHLDATHSFRPNQNAIETLDEKFSLYKNSNKTLVVGINIGMLCNYVEEGKDEHSDIKSAIRDFLKGNINSEDRYHFTNFEDYPKFQITGDKIHSEFILGLIEKITKKDVKNPFYKAFLAGGGGRIRENYILLQEPVIQNEIILLLLKARLKFDQFLTARTILDFVFCLLTDSGNLFDNLFSKSANELSNTIRHFDPCSIRSKAIDQFLIQRSVGIAEPEFIQFKSDFMERFYTNDFSHLTWVRVFYMLRELEISNNYHSNFKDDFDSELFDVYLNIWELHQKFSIGDEEAKRKVRSFYRLDFIAALLKFANRFSNGLTKEQLIDLGSYNGYRLAGIVDLKTDLKRIVNKNVSNLMHFSVYLKIGDKELSPIPVSVSFLELIIKINYGYRPNKHDKNTIIILEEIIDEIVRIVRKKDQLCIIKGTSKWNLEFDEEEQEIQVGGN